MWSLASAHNPPRVRSSRLIRDLVALSKVELDKSNMALSFNNVFLGFRDVPQVDVLNGKCHPFQAFEFSDCMPVSHYTFLR